MLESLKKELLDLATSFSLGVYMGISPRYPDSQYQIDLEKDIGGWSVIATLYTNCMTTMYMKDDGTFSFRHGTLHMFKTRNEALEAFSDTKHEKRERLFHE